jgi:hypothetical protein
MIFYEVTENTYQNVFFRSKFFYLNVDEKLLAKKWRHDTQHNDTRLNDIHHKD